MSSSHIYKNIFLIRHGYALHNKLYKEIGNRAFTEYLDTPLLPEGERQAKEFGKRFHNINIDIVIVSPLTRTLDTCKWIFSEKVKTKEIPFVVLDNLIEYPTGGNEICNKRKPAVDLSSNYDYDFSNIQNELFWPEEKETKEQLSFRCEQLKEYIKELPYKNIAVVSHSSFLKYFMNGTLDEEDESEEESLKHCYPYYYML